MLSISSGSCKKDVSPLLTHWNYVFLAQTHWYVAPLGLISCKFIDCFIAFGAGENLFFVLLPPGKVKEKEEAHREYKEAISKGHGAYLMDEEKPVSVKIKKKKKKRKKNV